MESCEKVEIKMFAVAISTEECYATMKRRDPRLRKLFEGATKPVGVHPAGDRQLLLYMTPSRAKRAQLELRLVFRTAQMIPTPVFVDARFFAGNNGERK